VGIFPFLEMEFMSLDKKAIMGAELAEYGLTELTEYGLAELAEYGPAELADSYGLAELAEYGLAELAECELSYE
jgi:Mn-dependent DtxR family transcriptional regulator